MISVLKQILFDNRHDWPTNGAALAILQYSHASLSNTEMFYCMEKLNIYETLVSFVEKCYKNETKRHLYEAITFLTMARQKMESITRILREQVYAACA